MQTPNLDTGVMGTACVSPPDPFDSKHIMNSVAGDESSPCYVEPPMIQGHEFVGEVVQVCLFLGHSVQ